MLRFFKKLRNSRFHRLKIILKSFFSQFLKRSWYFFHSCNSYNFDHLSKNSKIKLKINFNCLNASGEKKNILSKMLLTKLFLMSDDCTQRWNCWMHWQNCLFVRLLHSISSDQMHWRICLITDQSDFIDSIVAF